MTPEEAGDEDASGPPPHPLDRPWVHPSELVGRRPPSRAPRSRHTREWVIAFGAGTFGALAMVLVLAAAGLLGDANDPASPPLAAEVTGADGDAATRLAAAAGQSVVGLIVTTPMGPRRSSGVYVRNGEIVTSAHAVEGAEKLTVVDADGARRDGSVVGRDDSTRLALIRVDGDTEPAKLAAGTDVKVGQWVLALGGTDGTGPWVATGVVASMGGWADDGSGSMKPGMITVDTVTPPEARGGALLDRKGHVVGVLAGATGDATAGLATPISTVRSVAAQLAEKGKAAHGALGVHAVDASHPRGARVETVSPGSAADQAELDPGDVVVEVDGTRVRSVADLVVAVRRHEPGDRVQVVVERKDKPRRIAVVLGSAEDAVPADQTVTVSTSG